MIVRRQRIAFMVIQPVAIGGDTGHENIAMQIVPADARRAFHLRGRGATLPIVDVVEHYIEIFARQSALQRFRIVAVGGDVADFFAEIVPRLAMQHR